jgi:hypothetical protein
MAELYHLAAIQRRGRQIASSSSDGDDWNPSVGHTPQRRELYLGR